MFKSRICVIDTETTGIFNRDPWTEVVELGAVIIDRDGSELAAFSSLVKPDVLDERAAPAMAVNRIDPKHLDTARPAWLVLTEFVAWLSERDVQFLTAYNVAFDRAGLEQMGLDDSVFRWASCIMERAKEDTGAQGWLSLAKAAAHYGVTVVGDAHRAETDARTAAGVMRAIHSRATGRS